MKKVIVLIFLFFTNLLYGLDYYNVRDDIRNGNLRELGGFVDALNYHSDFGYFGWIVDLNKTELRLLRNTIYAKYGYRFNSTDLNEHFSRFIWYAGTKENVDNEITENEWNAINFIRRMEANYPSNIPNELIGHWYHINDSNWWSHSPWELANYYGRLHSHSPKELEFYPNGLFKYIHCKDYNGIECYGFWSFDSEIFKLNFIHIGIFQNFPENFNLDEHINSTRNFNENIIFFNKRLNDWEEDVYECFFQNNLYSWKKITGSPGFMGGDR